LRYKYSKRVAQAYTIRLSINENLKLEKGKEKSSSAARSYIQSSGHMTATCHHVTAICRNLTVVCQCCNKIFKDKDKKERDSITDLILVVVELLRRDINRLVKIV
jgi:hypothetical protein